MSPATATLSAPTTAATMPGEIIKLLCGLEIAGEIRPPLEAADVIRFSWRAPAEELDAKALKVKTVRMRTAVSRTKVGRREDGIFDR